MSTVREARIQAVMEKVWQRLPYVRTEDLKAVAEIAVDALFPDDPTNDMEVPPNG